MNETLKRVLKSILCILIVLILIVGGYVAYVFISYHRLEDNIALDVTRAGDAQPVVAGGSYRVVSYNIGFGAYSDDYSFFMDGGKESRARSAEDVRGNIGGAMSTVTSLTPDFVLVQEVDFDSTRARKVDERELVRLLLPQFPQTVFAQNYDSPYLFWPLTSPHGSNKSGLMTLSKYGVSSSLRRSLPIEEGVMKLVDLDRCYSVSRIPVEGGRELVLYDLHLSAYTSDGLIANEQLEMLFGDMLAEYNKGNWTVAGGDFNKDLLGNSPELFGVSGPEYTWAQPIPESMIPDELSIVALYDEQDPVASCRNADHPYDADSFRVTVDGFVVSANVRVDGGAVVDTGYRWSDHNPVYIDFTLLDD